MKTKIDVFMVCPSYSPLFAIGIVIWGNAISMPLWAGPSAWRRKLETICKRGGYRSFEAWTHLSQGADFCFGMDNKLSELLRGAVPRRMERRNVLAQTNERPCDGISDGF